MREAKKLLYRYSGKVRSKAPEIKIRKKAFKIPSNLKLVHEVPYASKYLRKRGFDVELLESRYNIKATGPISNLDKTDYAFGGNIGAALELQMAPKVDFNVTGKYLFSTYSQFIISVQVVYFFKVRRKVYRR